jgi:hypothetical protein
MAHARRFNPLLHIYMGVGLEADKLLPAGAASKPLDGHEGIGGMRFHGDGAGEQVGVCFFQPAFSQKEQADFGRTGNSAVSIAAMH